MSHREARFYHPVQPQDAVADLMRRVGAVVLWTADGVVACEVSWPAPDLDAGPEVLDALVATQQATAKACYAAVPVGWALRAGEVFASRDGRCGQQFKVVPL